MPGSWIKETFEKGVDELQKLAKTGSIKIDIANLKKKRDERIKVIGNKVLDMIKNGELKADVFEPDYSYVLDMEKKIARKESELIDGEPEKQPETEAKPQETAAQQEPQTQEEQEQPKPAASVMPGEEEDEEHDPHEDYINRPG